MCSCTDVSFPSPSSLLLLLFIVIIVVVVSVVVELFIQPVLNSFLFHSNHRNFVLPQAEHSLSSLNLVSFHVERF